VIGAVKDFHSDTQANSSANPSRRISAGFCMGTAEDYYKSFERK
jgi:hypothetical protein